MVLEIVHNDVFENFHLGNFCFKKTNKVFSMIALDQLHQQNNRTIKSSIANKFANKADDSVFFRWETCSAEISPIINESEDIFRSKIKNTVKPLYSGHHRDKSVRYRDVSAT